MNKKFFIGLGVLVVVLGFSANAYAQRANTSAAVKKQQTGRAGVARAGITRITTVATKVPTSGGTTTDTTTDDTKLDSLACSKAFYNKLVESGVCGGANLSTCNADFKVSLMNGDYTAFMASKGYIAQTVFTNCDCGTDSAGTALDCKKVAAMYVGSVMTDGIIKDYYSCQRSFNSCANAVCGTDYANCADLLTEKTYPTDGVESAQAISRELEKLLGELNSGSAYASTISGVGTRLQKRLGECRANILDKCEIASADGTSDNATRRQEIFDEYRDGLIRNGSKALIARYGNDAKKSIMDAYSCVDSVDACMKKQCGSDYNKCLNDDFTVNTSAVNNFKSLCQQDLISCAEVRALAQLEGYQYLADVKVDGVAQVWNDFITNRVLAYANAKAVDRKKLEEKLENLLSFAQKSCQDNGGVVQFIQEKLAIYDAKYGTSRTNDQVANDTGLFGTTTVDGDLEYSTTANDGARKGDRFYNKMVCAFPLTGNKDANSNMPKIILMGESKVCDATFFDVDKKAGGRIVGSIVGAGVGTAAGLLTSGALKKDPSKDIADINIAILKVEECIAAKDDVNKYDKLREEAANLVNKAGVMVTVDNACDSGTKASLTKKLDQGGGKLIENQKAQNAVLGTAGGLALGAAGFGVGSAIDKKNAEKKQDELKCVVGGKQYAIGETITVARSSAFRELEDFYQQNPNLLAERGEYINSKYRGESVVAGPQGDQKDSNIKNESLFQ